MFYSMRTSKLFIALVILIINQGCGQDEEFVTVNVTFNYINETSEIVRIFGGCGFDSLDTRSGFENALLVQPNETLITRQTDRIIMKSDKPSVSNFDLFTSGCRAIYGDSVKCDVSGFFGIRGLENYENREELSKNNFEFTYRFTEETMNEAGNCE